VNGPIVISAARATIQAQTVPTLRPNGIGLNGSLEGVSRDVFTAGLSATGRTHFSSVMAVGSRRSSASVEMRDGSLEAENQLAEV
jgi:hypothetical protein